MGQKRPQMGEAMELGGGAVVSEAQDGGGLVGHKAQLFELASQEFEA